jgi:hypothetical protein
MWIVGDEMHFYFAVQEIERRLGFSRGAAEKRLRELCASGEVRSWKKPYLDVGGGYAQAMAPEWERVLPSQWKTHEVDLTPDANGYENCVRVSKVDLEQQIGKTGTQECIEVNAPITAPPPRQRKAPRQRRSPTKLDQAKAAVRELGLNSRPEAETAKEALRKLGDGLNRRGIRGISDTTLRRALGLRAD